MVLLGDVEKYAVLSIVHLQKETIIARGYIL